MLPPQLSGADGGDGPQLGSGGPPERRREKKRERGLFDLPESPEEMMKDGEATVAYVSDVVSKLRAEGADVRCGACVAGDVQSAFPDLRAALGAVGVPEVSRIEGVWVVPPFVLKGLDTRLRWHEVRGRLGPFLKNDIWHRINGEVCQGLAVDWAKMGLQPENLVVAKHRATWRMMGEKLLAHVTWSGMKQLARYAYAHATRRNAAAERHAMSSS